MMRDDLRVGDSFVIEVEGRVTQYSKMQGKDDTAKALLELKYEVQPGDQLVLAETGIVEWLEEEV